jgi:ribonuclease P protein component
MTPPEEPGQGITAEASVAPPAVSLCVTGSDTAAGERLAIQTLRHRKDFLRAASARRQGTGGFLLQARHRDDTDLAVRVGFTASKKIGNSVFRNRAKRRLREVARAVLPVLGVPGWDYVLVARPGATVERDFAALLEDMRAAMRSVHRAAK